MKIKYLYHASSNKNIKVLKPKAESVRDPNEGPVLFASKDKAYVTCFIVPTDNSWTKISKYTSTEHPPIYITCISDEKRFRELDRGGAVYYLSPKGFYLDKSKGDLEWTIKNEVKPLKKDLYGSGLDAMVDHGVIVYFCDKRTFLELKKDPHDVIRSMHILKSLKSENEKRGLKNPIYEYY